MSRILKMLFLIGALLAMPQDGWTAEPIFVVHFTTGPGWQPDVSPGEQIGFAEHSANLRRLRDAGRIHFGARYGPYGMIFLAADSLEGARAELESDPGVAAGIFTFEVAQMSVFFPWRTEPEPVDQPEKQNDGEGS